MFLTLFILNQLLLPNQKPVAVLHEPTVQGIVLHQDQYAPVATFKNVPEKGIELHESPVTGTPLTEPVETPVVTWSF